MRRNIHPVADHNRKVFERPEVVRRYTADVRLTPAETQIFGHLGNYAGKRVLDLGVGGGRTTRVVAASARLYVGIDYSAGMIASCQQQFPRHRFEHGDARDLSRFHDGSFDFVIFSFNGLDLVGHADRARVLREVARVLVPGGLFTFSTHNLEWAKRRTMWRAMRHMRSSTNALRSAKRLARVGLRMANYIRHRSLQVWGHGYAMMLDPGEDFTVPIYYVSEKEQRRQLEAAGLAADVGVLPEYADEDNAVERVPYSHYYMARKV